MISRYTLPVVKLSLNYDGKKNVNCRKRYYVTLISIYVIVTVKAMNNFPSASVMHYME